MDHDDDRPEPDEVEDAIAEAEGMAPDDGGDLVYQARHRAAAASDPLRLIRAASDVLAADFDRGEPGSAEDVAIRDVRLAACARLIRLFAADIDAAAD